MLINTSTLSIISEQMFRSKYKNVSFPSPLTDEILAPFGYAVLNMITPPAYDWWTHRLVEGTPEQREGKWYQTWVLESVTHTPEEEAERLAAAKSTKLADIKSAFAAAEANGFVDSTLGFRIDATRRSIDDIEGLIDLVSSGATKAPVTFRGYDNTYHNLSLDQLNTLRIEAKGRGPILYAKKWELEAAVDKALTVEEVQTIITDSGWPGVEA